MLIETTATVTLPDAELRASRIADETYVRLSDVLHHLELVAARVDAAHGTADIGKTLRTVRDQLAQAEGVKLA